MQLFANLLLSVAHSTHAVLLPQTPLAELALYVRHQKILGYQTKTLNGQGIFVPLGRAMEKAPERSKRTSTLYILKTLIHLTIKSALYVYYSF